ncbi:hypothetical protein Ancab_031739 [Ancistrocladus abbreviatus]
MEAGGVSGSMFPSLGSGMLGLEMPLQRLPPPPPAAPPQQNPPHLPHNPFPQQQPPQPPPPPPSQMVAFAHQEHDDHQPEPHLSMKQTTYTFMPKSKQQNQQQANSDEDDPGFGNDDSSVDGKRKASPWQRMKWNDSMVKMLIMAVFYIGDEAGSEGNEKKKSGGSLQKKGKWKSVSRAMVEKGFKVSPQQCEDKFNDLNKRYKRVTDILGKGTACGIVENQSLLEAMDLTPKMKEEARKLLNSKHLFYKEMCAYHNSCAQLGGGRCGARIMAASCGNSAHRSAELSSEQLNIHPQQLPECFHSSDYNSAIPGSNRVAPEETSKMKGASIENEDDSEDNEDDDNDHDHDNDGQRKKARRDTSPTHVVQQFNGEIMNVLQDGTKSPWKKKQWMMRRMVELQEQGLKYKIKALEMAKQRVRWIKFCNKKEKEMKRMKYENHRRRLENERMLLILRQKELELSDQSRTRLPELADHCNV